MVYNRLRNIQRWLLPRYCLLCRADTASNADLCAECERSLPRLRSTCTRCAAPLASGTDADLVCGACQTTPPRFAFARAAFAYAPPQDRLIQGLKYHRRLDYGRVLGTYLADYLESLPDPRPDLVVPVPLHRSRLRERGYNQALEIARPVARRFNLPLEYRHVRRIRATAAQTDLPHKERRKNVRNAFQVNRDLSGRRVAIVDDVMTTGHTVNSLATNLLKAGADCVMMWALARA